jgi:hypothetical protein
MQAAGRLDREHRIGDIQMLEDEPLQSLQAGRSTGSDSGSTAIRPRWSSARSGC